MNILPKKSWHVRTKKNIERVRQDEAKAEELARLEEQRVLVAEQEARINYLRDRLRLEPSSASASGTNPILEKSISLTGSDGHINLFECAKDHQTSTNKEHDYEKKREEILWQSKQGILNKLGGLSNNVENPWYLQDHHKRMSQVADTTATNINTHYKKSSSSMPNSNTIQSVHDPLIVMQLAQRIITDNKSESEALGRPHTEPIAYDSKYTRDISLNPTLTTNSNEKSIPIDKKYKRHSGRKKSSDREKTKKHSHKKRSHKRGKHSKHKKHRRKSP